MPPTGFGSPTGPCIRCGSEDNVTHVRGANLCERCIARGVTPRYDADAAEKARQDAIAKAAQHKAAHRKLARIDADKAKAARVDERTAVIEAAAKRKADFEAKSKTGLLARRAWEENRRRWKQPGRVVRSGGAA